MKRIRRARRRLLSLLAAGLCAGGAMAAPLTFYVAPNGNDGWSGRVASVNGSKVGLYVFMLSSSPTDEIGLQAP
jgi:hypothetical protein